jgi:transposase-like protein
MSDVRVPKAAGSTQVNHCRNPNCHNFGTPAETKEIYRGRHKGQPFVREFATPETAYCPTPGCPNHDNVRTLAAARHEYSPDRTGGTPWSERWRCKKCKKTVRVGVPNAPPMPEPTVAHRDLYAVNNGVLHCHNCEDFVTLRSNEAIVEETRRLSIYLQARRGPACPGKQCESRLHAVDDADADQFYSKFGRTRAGSTRYRCKKCKSVVSVPRSTARQRRSEVNILFFKLLLARVSLSKIARVLEISRSTVYEKIDFLQRQCLAFQGDRERALSGRYFDELLLATDRQFYLCNWTRAVDARNLQITGVATADTRSGYVLAMNVAYDPEPDRKAVEADAIATGDYDGVAHPYRKYARVWLEGDFASNAERAAERREKSSKKRSEEDPADAEETIDPDEDEEEAFFSNRKLPDAGMLVHNDYTLHAHFQLLRRLIGGAERVCFYTEKEQGMRAAIMAAFHEQMLQERLDAFHVMVAKELTVNRRRALVGQSKAAYRNWLEERRAHGTIRGKDQDQCRAIRLLEAIDSPEMILDKGTKKWEPWIWHPFPNLAEPEKRVLPLTAQVPEATRTAGQMKLRLRPPIDRQRLAHLVDKASLHAVDRYFMQIRRELAGLERGIPVASNKRRLWYGLTPYDPSMIPKLLDIHRAYYNWIQVGEDGLTRAQRFGVARDKLGLAKGKIRYQDIVYYQ